MVKSNSAVDIVLSTFRPKRLYNSNDIRLRCRDIGFEFSEDAISLAIRALKRAGKIREVAPNNGGKNKAGAVVALVE